MLSQSDDFAAGQDDGEALDVTTRRTIFQPMAPARVDRHDAAHRRDFAIGRIGTEAATRFGQLAIELSQDDPGLDRDPVSGRPRSRAA